MPRTRFSAFDDTVDDLAHVELGLLARVRVEPLGVLDQMVGPLRAEQIGLLEEIEELVRRPFRIGKAPVARVGPGGGLGRFARHAFDRRRPQVEIGAPEARLHLDRALRIDQPIFGHSRERSDRVAHVLGGVGLERAFLARLEVGGERLAAFFHHAGDVAGELLDVDGGGWCGVFCRLRGRRGVLGVLGGLLDPVDRHNIPRCHVGRSGRRSFPRSFPPLAGLALFGQPAVLVHGFDILAL
jgi:hypothetical protein